MAVAGMVCGILAFFFSFIPCVGWFISLILSVLGIIFSGVGLAQAQKSGGHGKGMAITGLVMSILPLLWIPLFIVIIGGLGAASHSVH